MLVVLFDERKVQKYNRELLARKQAEKDKLYQASNPSPEQNLPDSKTKRAVRFYPGKRKRIPRGYYTDDCASDARLRRKLEKHGFNVISAFEAGNQSANDEIHLAYASAERRVIITCDKHFPKFHAAGKEHAGIIHAPDGPMWFQAILQACLRLEKDNINA